LINCVWQLFGTTKSADLLYGQAHNKGVVNPCQKRYKNGEIRRFLTAYVWTVIMFGLGAWELALILGVVVLLFGTKRLPELGSGLGQAISNFKKSYRDAQAIDVTPETKKEDNSENSSK
jgi:sec-independent protein translocase protein TatA